MTAFPSPFLLIFTKKTTTTFCLSQACLPAPLSLFNNAHSFLCSLHSISFCKTLYCYYSLLCIWSRSLKSSTTFSVWFSSLSQVMSQAACSLTVFKLLWKILVLKKRKVAITKLLITWLSWDGYNFLWFHSVSRFLVSTTGAWILFQPSPNWF